VTDANGNLWVAHWGAACVNCYDQSGTILHSIPTGAAQTSCPAFGGPDFTDLYATSAAINISDEDKAQRPQTGMTFIARGAGRGLPEPKVIL